MGSHKHDKKHDDKHKIHTTEKIALKASVIVCSDRASRGEYADESGPTAQTWLAHQGHEILGCLVIADDADALSAALSKSLAAGSDLVVISGGTGLGPRDITPQTLNRMCDFDIPGIGEHLRRESVRYSLNAYLSRGGAWAKDARLIVALPGNPKAVREQLDMLSDLIPHAIWSLRGECRHRHTES